MDGRELRLSAVPGGPSGSNARGMACVSKLSVM